MPLILKIISFRLGQVILIGLVVGILSFVMLQSLSGDIAFRIAAARYGYDLMDSTAAQAVRAELNLNQPLITQLYDWLLAIFSLDLGYSLVSGGSVIDEITHQLGTTILLAITSLIVSLLIALPVGIISAIYRNGWFDRCCYIISMLLKSIPSVILAIFLIMLFAISLNILPVAGYGEAKHLILPSLSLGLLLAAVSNRVIRDNVVQSLESPWYDFTQYKGLSQFLIIKNHVIRNSATPVIAYIGVQFAYIIEGVVVIETIFLLPGIGHALIHAVFARDIPMVQGVAVVLGCIYVLLNLLIDILCHAIDPRERNNKIF